MRQRDLRDIVILSGLALAASSPETHAATATATMAVTATVLSTCTIVAVPMAFGVYSSAAVSATSTLSITCSSTTPYNVGLDAGTGAGATIATRRMTSGTSTLAYTLSANAAHSVNVGQIIGTDTIAGIGTGLLQIITIYGQIGANQLSPAGVYTDTVTATITY